MSQIPARTQSLTNLLAVEAGRDGGTIGDIEQQLQLDTLAKRQSKPNKLKTRRNPPPSRPLPLQISVQPDHSGQVHDPNSRRESFSSGMSTLRRELINSMKWLSPATIEDSKVTALKRQFSRSKTPVEISIRDSFRRNLNTDQVPIKVQIVTQPLIKARKASVLDKTIIRNNRRCNIIMWLVLALIFSILAGGATLAGLYMYGKIFQSTTEEIIPINPVSPVDTQQITIDRNIPSGQFGCSNYPVRAPLNSRNYTDGFGSSAYLGCAYADVRYTLTECDLLAFAGGSKDGYEQVVKRYMDPLQKAMEVYDLNCAPSRIASFLGQVRHETAQFTRMIQPLDGGASALHVLPINFPLAISQIQPMQNIYNQLLSDGKVPALAQLTALVNSPNSQWSAQELQQVVTIGQLFAQDDMTFLVAAWWFAQGARQRLSGLQCEDLRVVSDSVKSDVDSNQSNFKQVSKCIFGSSSDPGLSQRQQFYQESLSYAQDNFKCQVVRCQS